MRYQPLKLVQRVVECVLDSLDIRCRQEVTFIVSRLVLQREQVLAEARGHEELLQDAVHVADHRRIRQAHELLIPPLCSLFDSPLFGWLDLVDHGTEVMVDEVSQRFDVLALLEDLRNEYKSPIATLSLALVRLSLIAST